MKHLSLTPEQLAILSEEGEVVIDDTGGSLVGTATFTRVRKPAAEPTSHRHLGYTSMSRVRARMEKLLQHIETYGELTSAEAVDFVRKLREAEAAQ